MYICIKDLGRKEGRLVECNAAGLRWVWIGILRRDGRWVWDMEDGRVVSGRGNLDVCKRGMRGGRWLEESGWQSLRRNKLMCERAGRV